MSHLSNDTQYHVGAEEIENISRMFSKLVAASEERTREYVHAATVSYPNILGLVANNSGTDIMRQAFAKIEAIIPFSYEQVLSSLEGGSGDIHASHAVLAGHGLGLCQPWTAEEDCECERHQNLLRETYLLAAYYSHGIEIVLTEETASVYHLQSYSYSNYSLGYSSKPSSDENFEQEAYWENVREFIRDALLEHPDLRPGTAILYGDRCTDKEFQAVLVQVLYQVLGEKNQPNWLQDGADPKFAGALGAAELLKRKTYRKHCLDGQWKMAL
ncbi:hypothetical protein CKM354_000856200 [Cercospora kikuchii]|uniref:Uncharacterized protein n=1 Tax=Cercospora kikuchii TaxID=84275 RepID=A0A9P3FII9_9PEZI|nr:uncharacterized protein CKM354_000856200 [Cercospora kikuchii]GIZ45392.1 hypothetical protein CKM354_000856200 [Cercospora kikuchii]